MLEEAGLKSSSGLWPVLVSQNIQWGYFWILWMFWSFSTTLKGWDLFGFCLKVLKTGCQWVFSQRKQVQICVSQSYSCSEELHRCPQPPCSDQSYLSVWQIWVNELISHTRTHLCHHHPSTLTSPWSLRSVWFMHTRCTGWKGFCDLYTSSELALRSSLSQINVINNKDKLQDIF